MVVTRSLNAPKNFPFFCSSFLYSSLFPAHALSFPFRSNPSPFSPNKCLLVHAKKRNSQLEPLLKRTTTDQEDKEEVDEFQEETFVEGDDDFEDEFEEEDTELHVGDGSGGGGILLAGTWWDRKALDLAEEVCISFGGDLKIYAFKTSASSTIKVRIENMANKYGSPSITDVENFSSAYRARLDEAEVAGAIPDNYSLEVSSPGVERIVRIPQELDRFKDKPMYVKYVTEEAATESPKESDGVFKLVSFDLESSYCTWSIADVRKNREQAGKGRPLSKKQREWRLQTPFDSLRLVRLYSDC